MEMQVRTYALGANISGLGVSFGVSAARQAWILMRDSPHEGVVGIKISDWFNFSGKGSVGGFTNVATDWFSVNLCANSWLFDLEDIVGRVGELTLTGAVLGGVEQSYTNVDFKVINQYGEIENRLSSRARPVALGSFSVGTIHVEGEIEQISEDISSYVTQESTLMTTDAYGNLYFESSSRSLNAGGISGGEGCEKEK